MTDDEVMRAMRDSKASWQDDKKGLKGDPVMYHRDVTPTSFAKSTIVADPPKFEKAEPGPRLPLGVNLDQLA